MGQIVPLLFFFKDGFGIKYSTKVDMPLHKETNQPTNKVWRIRKIVIFKFCTFWVEGGYSHNEGGSYVGLSFREIHMYFHLIEAPSPIVLSRMGGYNQMPKVVTLTWVFFALYIHVGLLIKLTICHMQVSST